MPMQSEAQRRMMHAAANDPKVAKKLKISRKVAKRFAKDDQGGKLPEKAADRGKKWYDGK